MKTQFDYSKLKALTAEQLRKIEAKLAKVKRIVFIEKSYK